MGLIISILVVVFCATVIVGMAVFLVIDMLGKVDDLGKYVPWLLRFVEKRQSHGVLLLVCGFLLIGNGYELVVKELPEVPTPPVVEIKAPAAPRIQGMPSRPLVKAAVDKSGPLDRFLNTEQKDHLYQELKRISADPRQKEYITVTIAAAYPHDRESSRLALQLIGVFQEARWNVIGQQVPNFEQQMQGQIPIGIWVSASNNMGPFVEGNLINVGLNADSRPLQGKLPSGFKSVLILIGYKANPF